MQISVSCSNYNEEDRSFRLEVHIENGPIFTEISMDFLTKGSNWAGVADAILNDGDFSVFADTSNGDCNIEVFNKNVVFHISKHSAGSMTLTIPSEYCRDAFSKLNNILLDDDEFL